MSSNTTNNGYFSKTFTMLNLNDGNNCLDFSDFLQRHHLTFDIRRTSSLAVRNINQNAIRPIRKDMANLKRHFNFKLSGNSSSQTPAPPLVEPLQLNGFSKSAFMNEVCTLLDQCGSYVAAMNAFCNSGCSLAKCLVKVFHAVPVYKDASCSLLSAWEEVASTAAAASASVKTETLMQLQDVLTKLESCAQESGCVDSEDGNQIIMESIHAVSACLLAYVELQSQFSYSVFKSLSKVSRQHSSNIGGKPSGLRAQDTVRKHFSQIVNRLTNVKTPTASMPNPASSPTSHLPNSNSPSHHTPISVWPAEINLAPSGVELASSSGHSSDRRSEGLRCASHCSSADNGLDDVINLLSIQAYPPGKASSIAQATAATPAVIASDQRTIEGRQHSLDPSSGVLSVAGEHTLWNKYGEEGGWTRWSQWSSDSCGNMWPQQQEQQCKESAGGWLSNASIDSQSSHVDGGAWSDVMNANTRFMQDKTWTWPRSEGPTPLSQLEWNDREQLDDKLLDETQLESREQRLHPKTCTWPLKLQQATTAQMSLTDTDCSSNELCHDLSTEALWTSMADMALPTSSRSPPPRPPAPSKPLKSWCPPTTTSPMPLSSSPSSCSIPVPHPTPPHSQWVPPGYSLFNQNN